MCSFAGFVQMLDWEALKNVAEFAAHVATVLAALAAGFWFLFSGSFRKRVQLDAECAVFGGYDHRKLVEITFVLSNKGQVETRCRTFAYEVEAIQPPDPARLNEVQNLPRPPLKRSGNIVPSEAEYYYVRAGVTTRISQRFWVPIDLTAIRVKGCMVYGRKRHRISPDQPLFCQVYKYPSWTAIDRTFSLTAFSSDAP
jgi:hypothetical protein